MLRLFSPAKINCFLHIIGKRTDGFHEIASLFRTISLGDILSFQKGVRDQVTSSIPSLPVDRTNFVVQALELFRAKTGIQDAYEIHIEKNIPMQAGLGGGSSNASTTLWALNQLNGLPASEDELREWSSEIGSDQAFFFSEGCAYCTGRGERIEAVPPPSSSPSSFTLVKPEEGLSTPLVFQELRAAQKGALLPYSHFSNKYFNDLEAPAFSLAPSLKELKDMLLDSGFHTVVMTGSGTSFFCFGTGSIPSIPSLKSYRCHFIHRKKNNWYTSDL